MDFIGERYYKLNKILLQCLGLWPYQTSKKTLKKAQVIFFQTLFISFLIYQCYILTVKEYNLDCIIKILSFVVIDCAYIVKYNACLLLTDNIKYIFDRIRYDWNMLKAQTELEVIRRYAGDAKLYTICFMFLSICCSLGLLIMVCLPCIFDVILPMNESRLRQVPIVKYFVVEETYFFAILAHLIVTQYAGSVTVTSIATIMITFALHTCAMFQISSHRIKHIFDENVQQMPKDIKQYIFYKKLIHAVYFHRRAVDLANILTKSFAKLYFVLLGFGVALTSFNFLNLYNAIVSLDEVELLIFGTIIFINLYYLFLGNYIGQNIIDSSMGICQATYNAQWYTAPLCMQKLILFIMQRSNRKSALTAGLFDASLEGFATLMSMALSYVMVLQSVGMHKESHETDNSHA